MFNRKSLPIWVIGIAVFALALVLGLTSVKSDTVYASTAGTPVALNSTTGVPRIAEFFNRTPIIATTRVCKDLRNYKTADFQYVVDESTSNSLTLRLQFTIDGINFVDGPALVAAGAVADTDGLTSLGIMGVQTCVRIKVTNANTVTLTTIGLAK